MSRKLVSIKERLGNLADWEFIRYETLVQKINCEATGALIRKAVVIKHKTGENVPESLQDREVYCAVNAIRKYVLPDMPTKYELRSQEARIRREKIQTEREKYVQEYLREFENAEF